MDKNKIEGNKETFKPKLYHSFSFFTVSKITLNSSFLYLKQK